ncbi:mucin-5AC-like [Xyrauchen texanus]|uniref:mucin-5AC-like n=1 Tax=Xyrauchen texanus TaxID=154827 RepID=UPI0022422ADE|nr:mucin-5AC-like [Xyrauchen texanus]
MEKCPGILKWTLEWILLFVGIIAAQTGVNPSHNGQICSTWGNYHFKTFDGYSFRLPSTCNYILTATCGSSYEDFNIQLRRQVLHDQPTITSITMKLDGTVVELIKSSVRVDGQLTTLPFSNYGVLIDKSSSYIKVSAKLGLVAMWNVDDSFMVELDKKYQNKTCGLCGDFNGVQLYNEFIKNGVETSLHEYGHLAKMDGPTESCTELVHSPDDSCQNLTSLCEQLFSGPPFSSCKGLVDSFIKTCELDLCHCTNTTRSFCLCSTFSEYSRQCVHAGGKPDTWRTEQFCGQSCPYHNMVHQECGNPCINTCSNPDKAHICEDHCIDGCFCPEGYVFDDLTDKGCIAKDQCSCIHNGKIYQPGQTYKSNCKECTCVNDQWSCKENDCPGTCSVEGGSHITTYDGRTYSFHGDCTYVLTKQTSGNEFIVLGDLMKCGLTDTETCLKAVTLFLSEGNTVFSIQSDGKVFVNRIYSQLPLSTAGVMIFKPTTFFIIVQTSFGLELEIQLIPIMQVYIKVDVSHKQKTNGLCGNFNSIQVDDFITVSGSLEGTAVGFANGWKTRAHCPDVKSNFVDPCSLSLDNERFAQKWCSQLTDPKGVFAPCHKEISPDVYQKTCMYDACNCEKSEDCMCAALSSYVHQCAAKGILLYNWRNATCGKFSGSCPSTMVYSYRVQNNSRSCRCHSDPDFTCGVTFEPVDGCVCAEGMYLHEEGQCVPPANCPCYAKGTVISPGEVINKDGTTCTCKGGKLSCTGQRIGRPSCPKHMVFFNCTNAAPGSTGSECQKSCNTLDMACISTECISGCMCPSGLVSDGRGHCIEEDLCPCIHNGNAHQPGDTIKVDCNTCTCKGKKWKCTKNPCHGTCTVYGDGHYITFDGKRYTFDGDCEYTLIRDYCGHANANASGTFRVLTENVPCGTTGTTCSKAVKVFLGNKELKLTDGGYQILNRDEGEEIPFQIRIMGIYMVIEANNGLIVMWDQKTSMFIKLSPKFKGTVCGLCGNYDGNANNDFMLRSQEVVNKALDFGNSWKESSSCRVATEIKNPCSNNPYRQSWAQKQCSIIKSDVFTVCHSQVDPSPFYESCVRDSCACDSGGDCDCFCTAVSAYAQACNEAGACVTWRTPQICPLFCDYYNPPGECEWHYKPCGAPCMQTCRNPTGHCSNQIPALEGCYPKCPPGQPYFDEDTMKCEKREQCGCYDKQGNHYDNQESVPTTKNCQICYNIYCYTVNNFNTHTYTTSCNIISSEFQHIFNCKPIHNSNNNIYCNTFKTSNKSANTNTINYNTNSPESLYKYKHIYNSFNNLTNFHYTNNNTNVYTNNPEFTHKYENNHNSNNNNYIYCYTFKNFNQHAYSTSCNNKGPEFHHQYKYIHDPNSYNIYCYTINNFNKHTYTTNCNIISPEYQHFFNNRCKLIHNSNKNIYCNTFKTADKPANTINYNTNSPESLYKYKHIHNSFNNLTNFHYTNINHNVYTSNFNTNNPEFTHKYENNHNSNNNNCNNKGPEFLHQYKYIHDPNSYNIYCYTINNFNKHTYTTNCNIISPEYQHFFCNKCKLIHNSNNNIYCNTFKTSNKPTNTNTNTINYNTNSPESLYKYKHIHNSFNNLTNFHYNNNNHHAYSASCNNKGPEFLHQYKYSHDPTSYNIYCYTINNFNKHTYTTNYNIISPEYHHFFNNKCHFYTINFINKYTFTTS